MAAKKVVVEKQRRLAHDDRRRLIIETTLACLARNGAEGTTLRSVCREMGVAPSLVKHFFDGWHDLLLAAYEMLAERFMAQLTPLITDEFPNARSRMDEVIARYLRTDWVGENTIGANIALWQLSRSVIDLKASFSRFLDDRSRILHKAFGALVRETGATVDVGEMTACLLLMLDGIWLELSLNPGSIAETRAQQMCWAWIDAVLGASAMARPPTPLPAKPRTPARGAASRAGAPKQAGAE